MLTNTNNLKSVTFGNSVRNPKAIRPMDLAELYDKLENGHWRKLIEAIRAEPKPEKQKQMKLMLPWFSFAVIEGSRAESNVVHANGIIFDFDHVPDSSPSKILLCDNSRGFTAVFRSPVDGLKLMLAFDRPVSNREEFRLIWDFLRHEIEAKTKLRADNTPDMSRACFVSWDDDFFGSATADPMNVDQVLQEAREWRDAREKEEKLPPRAELKTPATPREYDADLTAVQAKDAVEYLSKRVFGRREWIRCGIALFNHFGEDGIVYWLQFAENPHYGDSHEDLRKVWERLKRYPTVKIGTLFYIAESEGWINAYAPFEPREETPPALKGEEPMLTLEDYPELLELFGRPQNVELDRSKLPEEFLRYLDLVGEITDAQDGPKLTAMLPVVAANIGNRVHMYNAGTKHFCNIWAAIIGPSTVSRKTTVINQAMKMMKTFKDELAGIPAKERNERDIELSRVTQARLYNLLAINPNRLILQMELSAWMREMGKSYNAGMKQEITDMFDGKDRSIAKMEIDEHISKPAFSIVGATTEEWFFQELREVADQRGGFLQRFIICIIQNIELDELRLESVDSTNIDPELHAYGEMLQTFRSLPDSHRLKASDEAKDLRDTIYKDLMTAIALNANDPQAAYSARLFDNYFWRFCIIIHLMKNWKNLREAIATDRVESWFRQNEVDATTAEQAWYLCEYYFENTKPFLKQLAEGSKLDEERRVLRILQNSPRGEMTHSALLNRSRMNAREFRQLVETLIERQAIVRHQEMRFQNRIGLKYSLNPVLDEIKIG
ncbi:MAG: DUF3987 domain-containing protein [Candidatus Cloacimonetes bacterium]|nr:DUF3987 domain-containing protein [Candidatus Cloacimonadota bacterium]